ncbi:hypothetical protein CT0861_12219 [Colletotrichum tofieldiae]|uniref:Uncharacterized protein n=1 Tax=Colletotrichum tofieldiae TaxID=708197 RepID=A0A166P9J0_9PEZI|nr:hypothetical protein CT0861_12219 [Colletotrichum tofieldiae]
MDNSLRHSFQHIKEGMDCDISRVCSVPPPTPARPPLPNRTPPPSVPVTPNPLLDIGIFSCLSSGTQYDTNPGHPQLVSSHLPARAASFCSACTDTLINLPPSPISHTSYTTSPHVRIRAAPAIVHYSSAHAEEAGTVFIELQEHETDTCSPTSGTPRYRLAWKLSISSDGRTFAGSDVLALQHEMPWDKGCLM